jgi:hypothetical protein
LKITFDIRFIKRDKTFSAKARGLQPGRGNTPTAALISAMSVEENKFRIVSNSMKDVTGSPDFTASKVLERFPVGKGMGGGLYELIEEALIKGYLPDVYRDLRGIGMLRAVIGENLSINEAGKLYDLYPSNISRTIQIIWRRTLEKTRQRDIPPSVAGVATIEQMREHKDDVLHVLTWYERRLIASKQEPIEMLKRMIRGETLNEVAKSMSLTPDRVIQIVRFVWRRVALHARDASQSADTLHVNETIENLRYSHVIALRLIGMYEQHLKTRPKK